MAFPQTPLDVRTELQIGGVWTDISADVYLRNPISIERGRADEGTRADPTKCHLTINNRSGKYSLRNPSSPYFGLLGRNAPLRVSVPADATHLRALGTGASKMSTPDSALLSIAGDMDVRIEVALDSWATSQSLCGKYVTETNERTWAFRIATGGRLELRVSPDGFNIPAFGFLDIFSTVPVPAPVSGRLALRATVDVDNGAAGNTITFYTAATIGGTWTQLGAPVVTAGVTSFFDSPSALEVGDIADIGIPMVGKVYAFQLYSGIAGTIRANPNLTIQLPGATAFVDTAGTPNTWTVSSTASISDRDFRVHAEVSALPQRWDVSGKDVYAPADASGIMRRLGQGAAPLQSTMRRALITLAAVPPAAYWACEDAEGSTILASALPGGSPLNISGASTLATDNTFAASAPLPHFDGAIWTGSVPPYSTASGVSSVVFLLAVPAAGTTNGAVVARVYTTGTAARFDIVYSSAVFPDGQLDVNGYDAGGTLLFAGASGTGPINGTALRVEFRLTTSGANIQWSIQSRVVGEPGFGGGGGTLAGRTQGRIQRIVVNPGGTLTDTALGHLCVFDNFTDLFALSSQQDAYVGETAARRIARLCREEGIAFRNCGDPDDSADLGTQSVATLLALLEEAAGADLGILYEPREFLGLAYRTRVSLYNQPTTLALDYTAKGEVAHPLEPTDDDLTPRNDVTANRKNGSSARSKLDIGPMSILAPPNGIGLYDTSETYNVERDDQLPDIAGWRVHEGTWDEARYPQVNVDLAAGPHLITAGAKVVDCGDRLTIIHPPPGQPPDTIDQLAAGYTEVLGVYAWDLQLNCIPAGPWTVGILEDLVLGRGDIDGSQLAAGVSATATSLSVSVPSGPLWSVSAPQFPFDIRVAGEVMTVTNITGGTSPQTFTVTRSVNGVVKAQLSAADIRLAHPMIISL